MNVVVLQGMLSSEPRTQTLPSGSLLVAWEVTTEADGKKLTVPVVWFDPPRSVQLVGQADDVVVLGQVRRRYYRAGARTASSTEVVAVRAARASRAREVARVVDAAHAALPDVA